MRGRLVAAALAAGLATPAAAGAAADPLDQVRGLQDRDVRTNVQGPSAAQRSVVRALGADATWSRFGTPASLVAPGRTLGANVTGATATAAARSWISRNLSLYGLRSTDGLQVLNDSEPAGSAAAHAVTFQQYVGGLPAAGHRYRGQDSSGLARWTVLKLPSTGRR